MAHIFAIVAGRGRIEHTQALLHNGLLPPILGLPDVPHRDPLRTSLWRCDPQALRSLEAVPDRFRTALFHRLGLRYEAIVDADPPAVMTYGSQAGVARGDLPTRRHPQGSYAPRLSSAGHSGRALGAPRRAGTVPAVTGRGPVLAAPLATLPSTSAASRTRVRRAGACYDQASVQPLDGTRVGSCLVAHRTPPRKDRMVAAPSHEFREGWEAAECL